jgi:hypothetical protein
MDLNASSLETFYRCIDNASVLHHLNAYSNDKYPSTAAVRLL